MSWKFWQAKKKPAPARSARKPSGRRVDAFHQLILGAAARDGGSTCVDRILTWSGMTRQHAQRNLRDMARAGLVTRDADGHTYHVVGPLNAWWREWGGRS